MGATEEQMALLATAQVSHVSYILILYSVAFVMFLCKSQYPLWFGISVSNRVLQLLICFSTFMK